MEELGPTISRAVYGHRYTVALLLISNEFAGESKLKEQESGVWGCLAFCDDAKVTRPAENDKNNNNIDATPLLVVIRTLE
jgi:hypothetical protein